MARPTQTEYMYADCGLTSLSMKTFVIFSLIIRICVLVRNEKRERKKKNVNTLRRRKKENLG